MNGTARPRRVGHAFTLIELLVVVSIIALLISILLPSLRCAREQAKRVKCGANLHSIGLAVATCENENKGHGPKWDDGNVTQYMFTWLDVLFDTGYLGDIEVRHCPSDVNRESDDNPMVARGLAWNFWWVDEFNRGERLKPGVRTSYGISAIMHWNFEQDKHPDGARQVYAADGWWTWFGNLNAQWLFAPKFLNGRVPDPVNYPHWEGTMSAWRHGCGNGAPGANMLMRDGHTAFLTPREPRDRREFTDRIGVTVDTVNFFTWLPGERTTRFDFDAYNGSVKAWRARLPAFIEDSDQAPASFPEELDPNWRTLNRAWTKLPTIPNERR